MTIKRLNLGQIITAILIVVIICLSCRSIYVRYKVEHYGRNVVAKFVSKDKLPKTTNFYFSYYLDGKLIITANSGVDYSILNSEAETKIIDCMKVNSFYLAKHLPEYPNVIAVNTKNQIIDRVEIAKAGFKIVK